MSEIKENNVYLGDSYELIKSIKDKSIDCIYTDVPYLYDDHGEANEQKSDVAKDRLEGFNQKGEMNIFDI